MSYGSTSNTYPCGLVCPLRLSASSQVSQVCQGDLPPAQLLCVPARLTYSRTRLPSLSTSIVVVPPPAAGSYVNPLTAGTRYGSLPPTSWLTISTLPLPPWRTKLAVPSGSDGVGSPESSLVTPDSATTLYVNPSGSASRPAGSSTSGP